MFEYFVILQFVWSLFRRTMHDLQKKLSYNMSDNQNLQKALEGLMGSACYCCGSIPGMGIYLKNDIINVL